jgi:hypothetical protein
MLVKNPVLPHGASSKEKALKAWGHAPKPNLTIHPRSSERGILAFSRKATPRTYLLVAAFPLKD